MKLQGQWNVSELYLAASLNIHKHGSCKLSKPLFSVLFTRGWSEAEELSRWSISAFYICFNVLRTCSIEEFCSSSKAQFSLLEMSLRGWWLDTVLFGTHCICLLLWKTRPKNTRQKHVHTNTLWRTLCLWFNQRLAYATVFCGKKYKSVLLGSGFTVSSTETQCQFKCKWDGSQKLALNASFFGITSSLLPSTSNEWLNQFYSYSKGI